MTHFLRFIVKWVIIIITIEFEHDYICNKKESLYINKNQTGLNWDTVSKNLKDKKILIVETPNGARTYGNEWH